jgi:hypothetical protein
LCSCQELTIENLMEFRNPLCHNGTSEEKGGGPGSPPPP